ncbi:ATP-binding protein, partial [Anaerotignum sp.]
IGLYQTDNKYTHQSPQPINGILFYETDQPLTYLTRQWIVYPDILLAPEEIGEYQGYRYYENIGENGKNKSGSMTYQMTLLLPEETQEYALELPEIFSACKLYINDQLMLQLGDPTPEAYHEALGTRIVPFSAAGKTEILLAVSDFSGVNCGLTYPPAFGRGSDVLSMREFRLFLHEGLVLLSFLGAILSMIFGVRGNQKRGLLGSLLCLSLIVVTGYPLYHGFLTTAVQPWYTLEPVCHYVLLLLALLLQCSIYEIQPKLRLYLSIPCMIGILAAILSFGGASILPEGIAYGFSMLSAGLKYYTAFALFALSIWALRQEKCHSLLLLCGSSALVVCLIFDRLLPLYEPIYGGWFGEVGGCLLVGSIVLAIWMDAVHAYRYRLIYETNLMQMEQQLEMQKTHYQQLSSQIRLAKEAGHDLRHHIRIMRGFAEQQQWECLKDYLDTYEPHIQERQIQRWSEHHTADAVLQYYAALAKEQDALYDVQLTIPPDLAFPDDELCIILSNLLENAIDAVSSQIKGDKKIHLQGELINGSLGIVADNTFSRQIKQKNGVFLSTKHAGYGLGLRSIQTIAEKYGGIVDFSAENGTFKVSVLIPIASL